MPVANSRDMIENFLIKKLLNNYFSYFAHNYLINIEYSMISSYTLYMEGWVSWFKPAVC